MRRPTLAGNIANLRSWQPGQSGNPKGRPPAKRSSGLDEALAELLVANEGASMKTIASTLVKKAEEGDLRTVHLLVERTQGRPYQKIEIVPETPDQRFANLSTKEQIAEIDHAIKRLKEHREHFVNILENFPDD